jgi:hypothetical protein
MARTEANLAAGSWPTEVGMTRSWDALAKVLVSAIIVVILATQAVAGFVDTGKWGWPILAYPMYKHAYFEGDRLNHDFSVYALRSDGTRTEIKRSDLGMDFWIFWYNVISPVSLGRADVLEPILRRYCDELDNDVTMLQVEDKGIAIGRDGPVMGLPPQVVSETQVSCE